MLSRLWRWFAAVRQSKRAHAETWAPWVERQSDGLTRFQAFARSALEREFGPIPLELRGEKENYLFGLFPPLNVELYIYENGCELRDAVLEFRAERWDYNGPEDLVADLVLRARAVRSAAI